MGPAHTQHRHGEQGAARLQGRRGEPDRERWAGLPMEGTNPHGGTLQELLRRWDTRAFGSRRHHTVPPARRIILGPVIGARAIW